MLICLAFRRKEYVDRTDGTGDRRASVQDGSIIRTAGRELEFFLLAGRIV
jgi:hypothetical protein